MRIVTLLYFWVTLILLSSSRPSYSTGMTLNVGPLSGGQGGSNPLSIPPLNFAEYQFIYTTSQNSEFVVGVIPGIFYGIRSSEKSPVYVSVGGGLVIDLNGVGVGIMSSVGANLFCAKVCFNMEYRQALAPSSGTLLSPYALRIGASTFW